MERTQKKGKVEDVRKKKRKIRENPKVRRDPAHRWRIGLKVHGRDISHSNNRRKTKRTSANISKFINNETVISILQKKPVLKRKI